MCSCWRLVIQTLSLASATCVTESMCNYGHLFDACVSSGSWEADTEMGLDMPEIYWGEIRAMDNVDRSRSRWGRGPWGTQPSLWKKGGKEALIAQHWEAKIACRGSTALGRNGPAPSPSALLNHWLGATHCKAWPWGINPVGKYIRLAAGGCQPTTFLAVSPLRIRYEWNDSNATLDSKSHLTFFFLTFFKLRWNSHDIPLTILQCIHISGV